MLLPHGFTSCRRYCSFVQGKPGTSPPTAQRCGSGHCNLLRHTQCALHMQRTCMPSQHGVFSTVLWIQGSFQWESRYSCYRNTLFKTSKIPLLIELTWQGWRSAMACSQTSPPCSTTLKHCVDDQIQGNQSHLRKLVNDVNLHQWDQSWKDQPEMNKSKSI